MIDQKIHETTSCRKRTESDCPSTILSRLAWVSECRIKNNRIIGFDMTGMTKTTNTTKKEQGPRRNIAMTWDLFAEKERLWVIVVRESEQESSKP